ncbi:hypothetical protein D9M69_191300 [compost metagenome]
MAGRGAWQVFEDAVDQRGYVLGPLAQRWDGQAQDVQPIEQVFPETTVGQLAGVAGGDAAAFDHRLQAAEVLENGLRAVAFVQGQGDLFETDGAAGLVHQLLAGGDRHALGFT